MDEPPPGYAILLTTQQRAECSEARLVLAAANIFSEALYREGRWFLFVRHHDLAAAMAELNAFHQENPVRSAEESTSHPVFDGAAVGVLVYAITLTLVAAYAAHHTYGLQWLAAGEMQSGLVRDGQLWRIVTALTLHLDAGHIGSNLVFGTVFGFLAGRALGGGVAWLVIVIAGALGNLMNAMVQSAIHTSIGASTAVFSALGLLVAHALRNRGPVQENLLKRWSPLIGGVVLLAMTGVGDERTDVMAHVTGFLAGLLLGWLGSSVPAKWLANAAVQRTAGAATLIIVIVAWIIGLVIAG